MFRTWKPMELMDLALTEDGLLNSPTRMRTESLQVFSSGILLQTSVLQPAGSLEAAGCELPDSFWLATWWWTRAIRTRISATTKSSLRGYYWSLRAHISSMLS